MPACVAGLPDQATLAVSSQAYADDVGMLSGSLSGIQLQADKLTRFCDWAELVVSAKKTFITCALHGSADTSSAGITTARTRLGRQQVPGSTAQAPQWSSEAVQVQGRSIRYLDPNEPFTYLGVKMTMTCDWRPQLSAMMQTLQEKCENARQSFATPKMIRNMVKTSICPAVSWCFPVVPCSPSDLAAMDSVWAALVKKKFGLNTSAGLYSEDPRLT